MYFPPWALLPGLYAGHPEPASELLPRFGLFFLHFQYNGWFFLPLWDCWPTGSAGSARQTGNCSGFSGCLLQPVCLHIFVSALAAGCTLALPADCVGGLGNSSGLVENAGLLRGLNAMLRSSAPVFGRRILLLSGIALSIKLLLRPGSVIPPLSRLAFWFPSPS